MLTPLSRSTLVQTLLFSRAHGWTKTSAQAWIERHPEYRGDNSRIRITEDYVRVRQHDPEKFLRAGFGADGQFRTIDLGSFSRHGIRLPWGGSSLNGSSTAWW